jgi:hypothetical protein
MESKDSAYSNLWNLTECLVYQDLLFVLSMEGYSLFGTGRGKGGARVRVGW